VYLSHRYYDPNISSDQAAGLAEYWISETASQDPKVGGQIRIAKVYPGNGYKALADDEVFMLRKRNQKLNDKLRGFFKNGGR
jgi:20S proteasome alpha/beta subunit